MACSPPGCGVVLERKARTFNARVFFRVCFNDLGDPPATHGFFIHKPTFPQREVKKVRVHLSQKVERRPEPSLLWGCNSLPFVFLFLPFSFLCFSMFLGSEL